MRRSDTDEIRDNPLRQIADRIPGSHEIVRTDITDSAPRLRPTVTAPSASRPRGRSRIMGELSSRNALRRAILVAEILGPPKALQQSGNTGNTGSR